MTRVGHQSLSEVLATRSRDCADLVDVAEAVCGAFAARIPYRFGCLATTDPSTGLISWAWKTHPLEVGDEEFAAAEYGGPDINLFAEIGARPEPVGVLSLDTDGDPGSCRRFRDFLVPRFGFTDELRVVFRSQGLTWGALAIYRGADDPSFDARDAQTAATVHNDVARLIQDVLFRPRSTEAPGAVAGPSVIVVSSDDQVLNLTPAARVHIDELGGWDHGSLPATVLVTCAAARTTPALAVNRAIGRSGAWLVLRATTFAAPTRDDHRPDSDVVVTVDTASPGDIGALHLAARGLSPREQEVAALVLQGAATRAIATSLFLSPHTVQDHLKSIFSVLRRQPMGRGSTSSTTPSAADPKQTTDAR